MIKKTFALVLLAVLLLSLMACGKASETSIPMASKEEQEAFDAACALIESGDYVRAIDALAGIPLYDAVQKKINEANAALEQASVAHDSEDGNLIEIPLTVDNWAEYFEIQPCEMRDFNSWNEEIGHYSGFAVVLKDEYTDRFVMQDSITFYMYAGQKNQQTKVFAYIGAGDPYAQRGTLADHVGGAISNGMPDQVTPAPIADKDSITVANIDGTLVLKP